VTKSLQVIALTLQLVLRPGCIDEFSWSVSIQGKARFAANGGSPLQETERFLDVDRNAEPINTTWTEY
jgi:hypothetical protein